MNEVIRCPACLEMKYRMFGQKNNLDIFICQSCQTVYTAKSNNGSDCGNDSSSAYDYNSYYNAESLTVPDFVSKILEQIVDSFAPHRRLNRLLDVGCGAGTLLKLAAEKNWQVAGVEVSEPAVEFLRAQNIEVFHGELSAAHFTSDSFDVITAVEIFEHIANPLDLAKEIYRIMRPGGLLWATTPHGRGTSGRLLGAEWTCVAPPEHLHLFSVKGIKTLLKEAGFRQVTVLTHGVNPFEILHAFRQNFLSTKNVEANLKNERNQNFNRVGSTYKLNAALTSNASRRAIKNLVNQTLNLTRLGDSLKIQAIK